MANRKFVRALTLNTPGVISTPYLMKLFYELWGYVLYGASTPTAPAVGAFPASNPNNYPANALEGTSVQATGTNGQTTNGSNIFTSAGASFTSGMIGSVLTMWVPGSGSTDDGLYLITGVPSATQLQIQVANGGHPDPTTLQPVFNTRSSILYRVVNVSGISGLAFVTTDYIIFQLNPTASDNPNASQATSQVQCLMNGAGSLTGINMIGSPGGTWASTVLSGTFNVQNGNTAVTASVSQATVITAGSFITFASQAGVLYYISAFNGTTGITLGTAYTGTTNAATAATLNSFTDAMSGVTTNTNSGGFSNYNPTVYTITADFDGLFCFFKGNGSPGMSNIYFEAPTRVGTYPTTTSDQNPLVIGTDGLDTITMSVDQHGTNNMYMAGSDAVTRYHRPQVKSVTGDGDAAGGGNYNTIISAQGMNDVRLAYSYNKGSTFVSQILLAQRNVVANYTRARCLLKQITSCASVVPVIHRLGSNGQYLHIQNGVCMIWDNTIMPISLTPLGF